MGAIEFVEDDGGRAAAGFKGKAGDCVTRAIAIATDQDYQGVYDALSEGQKNQRLTKRYRKRKASARNGVSVQRKWFKDYMKSLDWEWVATMEIGSGCRVHLTANELPEGRLIVRLAGHCTAVIDGVLRDTFDCSWSWDKSNAEAVRNEVTGKMEWSVPPVKVQGKKCVYGYWKKAPR